MYRCLLQLHLTPQEASSLEAVCQRYQIRPEQVDAEFGVRPVRPEEGQYAVKVDADVAARVRDERGGSQHPDSDDDGLGPRISLVH